MIDTTKRCMGGPKYSSDYMHYVRGLSELFLLVLSLKLTNKFPIGQNVSLSFQCL